MIKPKVKSKVLAVVLAFIMAVTVFAQPVFAASEVSEYMQTEVVTQRERDTTPSEFMENTLTDDEMALLLSTLQQNPAGMMGFEGPYCIDGYNNETIGITVMFRTPPAVALRLINEAANQMAREGRMADQAFVGDALAAHRNFDAQLASIPVPFGAAPIEVVGSHHMLFNGVYLNVPASMVAQIAALPEVFAVTPSFEYFTMYELENMSEEQWMSRERLPLVEEGTPVDEDVVDLFAEVVQGQTVAGQVTVDAPAGALVLSNTNTVEELTVVYDSEVGENGIINVTVTALCAEGDDSPVGDYTVVLGIVFFDGPEFVAFSVDLNISVVEPPVVGPYVPHPEFNQGAKDLFDIAFIHEELGITGRGVKVGVIDSGVDYRHPVFAPYLIPSHRYTPGLGYYTLPGGNFVIQAGRETGRDASPMEGLAGATSNHGTHVAGIIVAMAPDIQLYGWRTLAAGGGGTQPANSVTLAIEHAYDLGIDIVNLSLGNRWNTPWQANSFALNIAALAGMISTNSAGNDGDGGSPRMAGRGGWYSLGGGPATSILGITVGAGQAGGRNIPGAIGSSLNGTPAEIFLIGPSGPNWTYVDLDGDYDYVWFGRMQLPAGGRPGAGYPAFIATVRNELFDGEQTPLEGQVVIINRGGGEFVTMQAMAEDLGAIAVVVVNNQADNSHLSGTVLNSPNQTIDAFSIRHLVGYELLGPVPPGAGDVVLPEDVVLQRGQLNFGELTLISTPDIMAAFSSIGPLGPIDNANHPATMQLLPHIIGPGVNILSSNNIQHGTQIDGRPYTLMGGTSMSAPAVAGIAALMIQQFPNANPLEIRSRMMSTARPLEDYAGQHSVLQVGAGFINPVAALTTPHFITTHHAVPFAGAVWGPGVGEATGPEAWSYQRMSSLSFGRVVAEIDEAASTSIIPVTIEGGFPSGAWNVSYELLMPTPALAPPDGNWAAWGPRMDNTITGVTVDIQQVNSVTFNVQLHHDGNPENRGFAQGYLTFTQGDIVLTTPFGAYFDVEVPPVPLEPNPNSVIWRPILSNWLTTPYNYGEPDPRAFSLVHPDPGFWLTGDVGAMTRSNFSSLDFGFIDPNDGPPRALEFSWAPYGTAFEDATLFGTGAPLAPGAFTTYVNVVRSIKGGFTDTTNAEQGIHVIWETPANRAQVLDPGVYNLFVRVVHGAGEEYDLVQVFPFVVTDERPTIELDNETINFEEGDEYVTVTGRVSSLGHELALENNLLFRPVAGVIDAVLDYSRTQLLLGNFVAGPVNPDGTFSFTVPAEEAELELRVIESVGQVSLPFLGLFWMAEPASANISYVYTVSVTELGPDLCEHCDDYPCVCIPCEHCDEYPCVCIPCEDCGEYPCECVVSTLHRITFMRNGGTLNGIARDIAVYNVPSGIPFNEVPVIIPVTLRDGFVLANWRVDFAGENRAHLFLTSAELETFVIVHGHLHALPDNSNLIIRAIWEVAPDEPGYDDDVYQYEYTTVALCEDCDAYPCECIAEVLYEDYDVYQSENAA